MTAFIKPENIIAQLALKPGQIVADLGSGSGFYAVAAAKTVGGTGTVYAVDVQENKLVATQSIARQKGIRNITTIQADLDKPLTGIAASSCDVVILASILHEVEQIEMLLKNTYRILKTGGTILSVDWKKEQTPFGPDIHRRVSLKDLKSRLASLGIHEGRELETDGYHYAHTFIK